MSITRQFMWQSDLDASGGQAPVESLAYSAIMGGIAEERVRFNLPFNHDRLGCCESGPSLPPIFGSGGRSGRRHSTVAVEDCAIKGSFGSKLGFRIGSAMQEHAIIASRVDDQSGARRCAEDHSSYSHRQQSDMRFANSALSSLSK
jgi:hypothetical protein